MSEPKRLIDLSHTVEDGMITYKGLPAPIICDYLSREASHKIYAEGTEFQIGKIEIISNTGTYLDSPFHRYAEGDDLSQLDLDRVAALPGMLVRIPQDHGRAVDADVFTGLDVRGKAVLVQTGWSRHWRTDQYFEGHTYLTENAALLLRDGGARLVGVDTYNIDDTGDMRRPVHTALLGAGILIVEHMTGLERIPDGAPFEFYAVPVKFKGVGTFPVRAFVAI